MEEENAVSELLALPTPENDAPDEEKPRKRRRLIRGNLARRKDGEIAASHAFAHRLRNAMVGHL